MRLQKDQSSAESSSVRPTNWADVAADAEREIVAAEARIRRLRRAAEIAKAKADAGDPFPR